MPALAASPADILRWLLVARGQVSDPTVLDPTTSLPVGAWPCSTDSEPDLPDNCVTITDQTSQDDGRDQIVGDLAQHYGIQMRFRSEDFPTGWAKADSVRVYLAKNVLLAQIALPQGGLYLIHSCSNVKGVIPLGKDTPNSRRSLFTLNLLMTVKQLS